jgi:hypothetical protein
MSNMDYRDPGNDPNFRLRTGSYGSSWAWIVGAIAIVVVLFLIFGLGGTGDQQATTKAPTTTGQTTRPMTPPMTPPATTGQGQVTPPANPSGTAPQGGSNQ